MIQKLDNNKGQCLCGEVRYILSGDVNGFYLCHCTRCQQSSGSAHASNAFLKNANLRFESGEGRINQYKLPGTRFTKRFCSQCGSPVPFSFEKGQSVFLPLGSLENGHELKPTAHIFTGYKKHWENSFLTTPAFEELPEKD